MSKKKYSIDVEIEITPEYLANRLFQDDIVDFAVELASHITNDALFEELIERLSKIKRKEKPDLTGY